MLTCRPVPGQPRRAVELLVVGALTIDRFPDGSAAAGGSVLHATRAAARARASITVVTAAGPEPEAQAALFELGRAGKVVVEGVPHTIVFEPDEEGGRRRVPAMGRGWSRPSRPGGARAGSSSPARRDRRGADDRRGRCLRRGDRDSARQGFVPGYGRARRGCRGRALARPATRRRSK